MNVSQGMRSVQSSDAEASIRDEDARTEQVKKKVAKKTKSSQSTSSSKELVLMSTEADGQRFSIILGSDTEITGVRAQGGYMMFHVPEELRDRVMKHTWITEGKLVEVE